MENLVFEKLQCTETGEYLVPALVVDEADLARGLPRAIRMLGFMNDAAYRRTLDTGLVTFWSRSQQGLWTKGERSGNTLQVRSIEADCDNDSLLLMVQANGPTCHKGSRSCFYDKD